MGPETRRERISGAWRRCASWVMMGVEGVGPCEGRSWAVVAPGAELGRQMLSAAGLALAWALRLGAP